MNSSTASQAALSRKVALASVWCGPAGMVLLGVGLVPLARFIPPPSPADTAKQIQRLYVHNLTGVRIGMTMSILGLALLIPWSVAVAVQTRRTERGVPALTYLQLAASAVSWTTGVLAPLVWAVAAFRPDAIAPDLTRALNDLGWFLFLFPWPPFLVWFIALGVAIVRDQSDPPVYPRWAAYLSFWAALAIAPGFTMVFFKTGPFAFNGLVTFYVAFVDFFIWVVVMTFLTIAAIKKQVESAPDERLLTALAL